MDKYQKLKEFILENFEATTSKKDRLHTQEILSILNEKGFTFSASKSAQIFKSMKIGEYRYDCIKNTKTRAGYYFIAYTGST